jgi:iron transport multicopper oxidase
VKIKVQNLGIEPSTIHWHGAHQNGSYFYDGVAEITQCNIPPGDSFEYEFVASPAGTHWYHSHTGEQPLDGLLV